VDLKKRIIYYGFGFIVGAIVVFFIWSKKDASFDYLPQARVIKDLKSKKIEISSQAKRSLIEYNIDSLTVVNLLDKADVDFSKSNTKAIPCKSYWVNTFLNDTKLSLVIENCDSIATIQRVIKK
jgi:hypothetical protein